MLSEENEGTKFEQLPSRAIRPNIDMKESGIQTNPAEPEFLFSDQSFDDRFQLLRRLAFRGNIRRRCGEVLTPRLTTDPRIVRRMTVCGVYVYWFTEMIAKDLELFG
jgi:hypothetical protein